MDIFGEEAAKISIENYQRCVSAGEAITYEDNFFFPTGEKIRLTTLTPVFEQGKVQYLVGFSKDITQQKQAEKERNQLLLRLKSMFTEHTAIMLLIEPTTGRIVDTNPAACDFYGYSHEELTALCIQDINMLPKEEVERFRLMALKEKQRYFIFPHRLKNGEIRLVDVYTCPIVQDGEPLLFSIIFDVTDREKYREDLYREKELMRTTLISIGDGVVTTDLEGRITALNREAEKITGWTNEEAKNRPFTDVFVLRGEETGQEVDNPISKVLQTGKITGLANHTVLVNKEGRMIPIADSAAPIKDEQEQTLGIVMVFRDVSIEKEHQQQILYLSYHDHLTGLYNRRFIEEEMIRLDTSCQFPIAVIMGDVNGLKLTNDVFGHQAGDQLLKSMAEVLQESCRPGDIIARWGGDEFLIMLPHTTAAQAQEIMERITARCRAKNVGDMNLNVSLGCAVKTSEDESLV
ncbi:MAG: PAS domain S-box protein, partial [Bacillota bacterium]